MSSYNELIKNFERIRAYMREFYVYGFKSREEYRGRSARTYDDERRRLESWLGENMSFVRTPEGKNVFISIDSRESGRNPLFKAWKARSFTDGDITLHFILFDILVGESEYSIPELMKIIDEKYLSGFDEPLMLDESTVRKKLKEYCDIGIVEKRREGKRMVYRRAEDLDELPDPLVLSFFSELAPVGVVGSFLLDRMDREEHPFDFKHHYITGVLDSSVLAALFDAMRRESVITVSNLSRRSDEPKRLRLIPLRVLISAQNGRQHLIAYNPESNAILGYRVDYLSNVKIEEQSPRFTELRKMLDRMQENMWGVTTSRGLLGKRRLERVEMLIHIGKGEDYIIERLEREKRCGRVERVDGESYLFSAEVIDTVEMLPWLRTFISRIVDIRFSSRVAERQFKEDLKRMYGMYGIGGEGDDF